ADEANPDSRQGNSESSKPASGDKPTNQERSKSNETATHTGTASTVDPLRDSGESRRESNAPAFDRPPLRSQGHRVEATRDANPDSRPQTSSQRPSYSSNGPARQGDSRQYPQYPQGRST